MAFFDKVGQTLSNFGNDVSNKTKSMVEVNNLNGQLKNCEDALKMYYTEIGRLYYEQTKDLPPAQMVDLFSKVEEATVAIEHLKNSIRRAKGTKICQNCNAEVSLDTVFCPSCGSRIDDNASCNATNAPQQPTTIEKTYCPQCRAEISADATFCVNCGTKIG